MSHELDFTTGRAAIAFTGETPWHGFGIKLDENATPDQWRVAAGLDYDVVSRPIFYGVQGADGNKKAQVISDRRALLRDDTQDFLSIVSDKYVIAQPSKIFSFFTELLKNNGLRMETAGALDEGRKIWALAHIDDDFTIMGRDQVKPYILVATSYDGSLSTTAMFSTVRVVCNNTLRFSGAYDADSINDDVYKVRHDKEFSITEAHGKLGLDENAWNAYKQNMENLARLQVSPNDVLEYFYTVAGQGDMIERNDESGEIISFPEPGRVVKQFINGYKNGPGAQLPSADGTMFGALQAVTFYQDHLAPAGNRGKRFDSATFGSGNLRKQHAVDLALSKLEAA